MFDETVCSDSSETFGKVFDYCTFTDIATGGSGVVLHAYGNNCGYYFKNSVFERNYITLN